ncbi:MAG TPA: wax ester/triacylglycerol synthase family O-acyltransferase [Anaerolineae bacterium]
MAAARLKSEAMSKVDAAWLHMDSPTNMMMITGVMMFDRPVSFARLKATYEYRLARRYPRFLMRVREGNLLTGPRWEPDPHFDLSSHVHRVALPPPGDQAALQELVGDLMSTPLDYHKAPWQVHLVENFGAGSAVVTRLSHALADGIALMHVLLEMADPGPDAPVPELEEAFEYRPPIWTRIIVPTMGAVDSTLRLGETVVHESMETIAHPERLLEVAKAGLGAARFGTAYTLALGKLLLLPPDPRTAFKGKLGVAKAAAWTQHLSLADVKAVGKVLCGTVNDVLLAAVAGGLRRYLQGRGERTEGLNLRAMVPVNLRPAEEEFGKLGNRFGLIYLSLPVGIEDTQERLRTLKRRMDAIKNTPEALVSFDILQAIGLTPVQMEKIFTTIFTVKATGVMTNVPGPRETVYLFGAPLAGMMFWVPTSSELSLGVSIFSYAGQVIVGIATDAGLAPDPESIVTAIEAEFREMQDYVRYVAEDTEGQTAETALPLLDDEGDEDNGLPLEAPESEPVALPRPQSREAPVPTAAAAVAAVEAAFEEAGVAVQPSNAPSPCRATTKAGQPCRNRALPGQPFCRVHRAEARG